MLVWSSIISSTHHNFMVKGHELSQATYGPNKRFCIIEVRCYDAERLPDRRYRVRDAHTVSDADVKAGKRPAIVHEAWTLDEALAWCDMTSAA